jgi:hypothetical protein
MRPSGFRRIEVNVTLAGAATLKARCNPKRLARVCGNHLRPTTDPWDLTEPIERVRCSEPAGTPINPPAYCPQRQEPRRTLPKAGGVFVRCSKPHKQSSAPFGLRSWNGLLDEFAVNAYWSGHYKDCVEAVLMALSRGKVPSHEQSRFVQNAQFALEKWPSTASLT